MTLRVNQRRLSRDAYLRQLADAGITATACPFSPVGIQLASPCDVQLLPGFADGLVSVQDEAAQLAAPLLDLKPGLRVLDACFDLPKSDSSAAEEPSKAPIATESRGLQVLVVDDNVVNQKLAAKMDEILELENGNIKRKQLL
mgnify:CR=1 FL=1